MSIDPTGAATGGGLSSNKQSHTDRYPNWRLDRALSDFNNTHVLLANLLYEFPIGKARTRFVARQAGEPNYWRLVLHRHLRVPERRNHIASPAVRSRRTARTVSFAQVRGPLDKGHIQFVNGVEGPVMYNATKRITNVADPNFIASTSLHADLLLHPPAGTERQCRNIVQGPNFWNLDSGLLKDFGITERFKLQFRAEVFNVLNHANWENPRNATTGSPSIRSSIFGQTCCVSASLPSSATVIAIGEPNRVMQLGLKLNF